MSALARFCRFVLVYNLAVILWGAYVRASGSGAGCGSHWPTCNGEVVPPRPSTATVVEYSHRVSSLLVLVLVAILVVWAFRAAPAGHPLRRGAVLALVFTLSEAAVGAGLVLFKLVAHDESLARALAISTHLLNTLLLLAALTLAARAAGAFRSGPAPGFERRGPADMADPADIGGGAGIARPWRPGLLLRPGWSLALGLGATMAIAATGAVAALGDTLFPATSLATGFARDLSPASHLLLRLRTLHPLLSIALGAYLLVLCGQVAALGGQARAWAKRLRFLVLGQWTAGVLNVALLAPIWLQLVHLLLADLVWITLVLMSLEALAHQPAADARLQPLAAAAAEG